MTHPSKAKGDRGEREVADLLRAVFPDARRRVNGEESQDDLPGRDVQGVPGYCVQVRVYAKDARVTQKLGEAVSSALVGEIPVVFTKKISKIATGEPWLVSMRARDFVRLLQKVNGLRQDVATLDRFADVLEPCVCSEPKDEHGGDPRFPGSTACRNQGCGCLAYEPYRP